MKIGPSLTLLHLSDLHFGQVQGEPAARFDQQEVIARLLEDIVRMKDAIGAPDQVLITGDIAFSGKTAEYLGDGTGAPNAKEWLEALTKALEVTKDRILMVPGNHDLDRGKAVGSFVSKGTHQLLRNAPSQLDDLLLLANEGQLRENLWPKLTAYADFSKDYGASPISPASPWWRQPVASGLGSVMILGLNTCLLSYDGDDSPQNLALGSGQLTRVLEGLDSQTLLITLLHHPPEWLMDGQALITRLQNFPHVLFVGHVHQQGGLVTSPRPQGGSTRFVAGAAHETAKEGGRHAYAWVRIHAGGIDFYPRFWNKNLHSFQAERNNFGDLDNTGKTTIKNTKLPDKLEKWLEALQAPTLIPGTALTAPVIARPPRAIWSTWLQHSYEKHRWLQMYGIHRPGAEALRVELEQVYVELQATGSRAKGEQRMEEASGEQRMASGRRGEQLAEMHELSRSMGLHDALKRDRRVLILGDPGSGKTTLLRYICRVLALGWVDPSKASDARKLLDLEADAPLPVPILLTLVALNRYLEKHDIEQDDIRAETARAFLLDELNRFDCGVRASELTEALGTGQVILLLDGLDEVPGHPDRLKVAAAVSTLLSAYPAMRVVLTSRTRAFQGALTDALAQLETFVLLPMSRPEVSRFLRLWFGAVHAPDEVLAESDAAALAHEVQQHREIRRMALNPNLLTLIAILKFTRARLPDRRVELYSEIIDLFLERRDLERRTNEAWERLALDLTLSEKRLLVARLALEMHEGGGEFGAADHKKRGRTVSSKLPVMCFAKNLLRSGKCNTEPEALEKGAQFLDWLELRSGLLRKTEEGVEFTHLGYQEHLVAEALSSLSPEDAIWSAMKGHLQDDWWNEPIRLLLALLKERSSGLMTRLTQAGLVQGGARDWSVAGRGIALAFGALQDIPPLHLAPGTHQTVLNSLELLTGKNTQVPLKDRIEALLALGQVGDPRLGMEKADRWVEIKPGSFMMGATDWAESQPIHSVDIQHPFWLGRYPVTHEEYRPFVDEGGYNDPELWKEDWQSCEQYKVERPEQWDDARYNAPNQPVVGVTWWEARAYCRWLTRRLEKARPSGWPNGMIVRLPSEAEWEYAARGTGGSKYPWGDELPTADLANFSGAEIGRTSPVGAFPRGATPEGVLDMSGNVWEWCEDPWRNNYTKGDNGEKHQTVSSAGRVIRGGAWNDGAGRVRAAYRFGCRSGDRHDNLGFRVVCVSAEHG